MSLSSSLFPSPLRVRSGRGSALHGGNAVFLLFVVSGLLLLLQTHVAEAACPPQGCGRFGSCKKDTRSCGDNCQDVCKCLPNYYGPDCSFKAEVCPSGSGTTSGSTTTTSEHVCYNGGTCYKVETPSSTPGQGSVVTWSCDCRHAYGDAAIYAGAQCEYPSDVSCEIGNPSSIYAFCVNNGKCISMIKSGEQHPGCYCQPGFEGRHCQYAFGTAPAEELVYSPHMGHPSVSTKAGAGGLTGFEIFLIVVLALVFVFGVAFFAMRVHNKRLLEELEMEEQHHHQQEYGESGETKALAMPHHQSGDGFMHDDTEESSSGRAPHQSPEFLNANNPDHTNGIIYDGASTAPRYNEAEII